ncbi:hypothetical protein E3U55_16270 [Filobacillus milosensis]|uniref:Uncharacterized protein n=1 Tax=Filobacillus milosensis TaxID=94137 RepID=A0A4Y8IBE9_9BACI|nr:hypothetical protein [Filobacillus milosensis]TFB13286.1 hypothetical protein E3U55_16270 [Filobacillus milosensis]
MNYKRAFRLLLLSVFVVYIFCNVSGTAINDIPIDTPNSITEINESNYSFYGFDDHKKLNKFFFLFVPLLIIPILLNIRFDLIPDWYYRLRLLILTPVYYGSNYVKHSF